MINFRLLWNNHYPNIRPCIYENQCAVRMGEAFKKSKVDISSFTGARCWSHTPRHILRAEELAEWMTKQKNAHYFGKRQIYLNVTHTDFSGKKGIVFVKDGWPRGGDHIDLWDGFKLKAGDLDYFGKGKQIWFWELV